MFKNVKLTGQTIQELTLNFSKKRFWIIWIISKRSDRIVDGEIVILQFDMTGGAVLVESVQRHLAALVQFDRLRVIRERIVVLCATEVPITAIL